METNPSDYLKGIYSARRERNPAYSLGAYARDLGVSLSILSRILNGKRAVSLKLGLQIGHVLGLDEKTRSELMSSIMSALPQGAKVPLRLRQQFHHQKTLGPDAVMLSKIVGADEFDAISNWYHLAILNLMRLPGFHPEPQHISKQLHISVEESRGALERLEQAGFIERVEGLLQRSAKSFSFQGKNSEASLRRFHTQMITKAIDTLSFTDSKSFSERLISGITLSCSVEQIETLKDKVDKFQADILDFLSKSEVPPDSLYQFNVQLFSLTHHISKENV